MLYTVNKLVFFKERPYRKIIKYRCKNTEKVFSKLTCTRYVLEILRTQNRIKKKIFCHSLKKHNAHMIDWWQKIQSFYTILFRHNFFSNKHLDHGTSEKNRQRAYKHFLPF